VATTAIVGPAPSASAGGSCTLGCSETHNHSQYSVTVGRNWSSSPSPTKVLAPGESTPDKQDWDAFRVDGGWCYHVGWRVYGVYVNDKVYDRRGKGQQWIQVHNDESAIIYKQTTVNGASCT